MFKGFKDRREGGRVLATKLSKYNNRKDLIVLALPRGGVPVAFEVARALNAPLRVFIVRKLGVPGQVELAFGAIASGGIMIFNESLINQLQIPEQSIKKVIEKEQQELERRERLYQAKHSALNLQDKIVIIVDDGLATGATMRAAVAAVKILKPKQIVVAAPVASSQTCGEIMHKTDNLCICVISPEPFYGVGMWYRNFEQTTDEEVQEFLALAEKKLPGTQLAA